MNKNTLNEVNYIKYLLDYSRGKVISEQKNILSEQTKQDYDQIANQLSSTWGDTLKKYAFKDTITFYGTDENGNLIEDYSTKPTVIGIGLSSLYETGNNGSFETAFFGCSTQVKIINPYDKTKLTAFDMATNQFASLQPGGIDYRYSNTTGEKNDVKLNALRKTFNDTTRNIAKQICQLIDSVSKGEDIQPKLNAIIDSESKANQSKTVKPATSATPVKPAATTTEIDPSNNLPPFDKPIVEVVRDKNLWRVYAFGSFPVDVTKNNLSKEFIKEFAKKIFEDTVLSKTKGNVSITLAKLRGGASNYNSGPVFPDIKFTGNNWKTFTKINTATSGDTKYTGRRDVNTNLALTRAKNLFTQMKLILPDIANKLSELSSELKQKNPSLTNPKISVDITPTYENYNVYTGDKNDTERDKTKYPVPGQQVYMDLTIQIEPDKEKSAECMKGLSIKVEHLEHDCDYGQYNLYVNGILIGMSDVSTRSLGTATAPTYSYAKNGAIIAKYTNNKIGKLGVRTDTFTIPAAAVKTFLKNSKKGEIRITGQEADEGRHAEQPIFSVTNAAGTKILDRFPPPANAKCGKERPSDPRPRISPEVNKCTKFDMVIFNPCSDDPSSADLGLNYGKNL